MEGFMTRLARVVAPGYPHHITQRGNRRQPTFFDENDYKLYLSLLQDECEKAGVQVWAYCLMPNHVHLIVVPEVQESLSKAVGQTHRKYTLAINEKMGWRGYLWQGRFASFPMDETYFLAATRYVELNPVKANLVQFPGEYEWSSARFHLKMCDNPFLLQSPLREMIDDWANFLSAGQDEELVQKVGRANSTGRPLGSEKFVGLLEKELGRSLLPKRPGPKRSNYGDT
jgi:putative transposase